MQNINLKENFGEIKRNVKYINLKADILYTVITVLFGSYWEYGNNSAWRHNIFSVYTQKRRSIMDLSVTGASTYSTTASQKADTSKKAEDTAAKKSETDKKAQEKNGAVYEKDNSKVKKNSANQIYNRDAVVAKLKADQDSRAQSMQGLVEKLLGKQKGKFDIANSKNLFSVFSDAAKNADPATIKQAQEDISEDGYWGVNKTSDRLVSMAIALSGGDTDKADEMMKAIQKGFDKATAAWGKELPQISKDTLDAAMKKMQDWKNGVTTAEDYAAYLS